MSPDSKAGPPSPSSLPSLKEAAEPTPLAGPRYAVYWAPAEDHPLWAAGCSWLGRDAADRQRPDGSAPPGRAEPWRYGFHATLKPPMRLREGQTLADLEAALAQLATGRSSMRLEALQVATLGSFVALRLAHTPPALKALADACVVQLDRFRALPTGAELARRAAGLDAAQLERLGRWGYPHVLAGWRFHMTLTDAIADEAARGAQARQAALHFAQALAQPVQVSELCLFEEPQAGQPLWLRRRFSLGP